MHKVMGNDSTSNGCRAFRAKSEVLIFLVNKRIHLLHDYIRFLAQTMREYVRVLNDRGSNLQIKLIL